LTKSLSNTWHRVIVKEAHKEQAQQWLQDMNIVAHVQGFNDDYFDTELNTIQFTFYEHENSDISCALKFASKFSKHNEVRTYE
jgi:hypothetical protein